MDAEKDVSKDVATSEGLASSEDPNKQTTAPSTESEHIPDPSAEFLKRKARLREEATAQPRPPFKGDHKGGYRGNTSSGAFRPLMHGHGK